MLQERQAARRTQDAMHAGAAYRREMEELKEHAAVDLQALPLSSAMFICISECIMCLDVFLCICQWLLSTCRRCP